MNSEDFVCALKVIAVDNVNSGVLSSLVKPPGRSPSARLVALSHWFDQLSELDRLAVEEVVSMASKQSLYNVLLVFDGLLGVDPSGVGGELEVTYKYAGERICLNRPGVEFLTEIFKRSH